MKFDAYAAFTQWYLTTRVIKTEIFGQKAKIFSFVFQKIDIQSNVILQFLLLVN